jgi:hypothetical protein
MSADMKKHKCDFSEPNLDALVITQRVTRMERRVTVIKRRVATIE